MVFSVSDVAIASDGWRLIRTIANGNVEIVVVDKDRTADVDVYRLAISQSRACMGVLRGRRNMCKILFWSDPAMTPTRFPLSDAQVNTQVADWTYNGHTGYR